MTDYYKVIEDGYVTGFGTNGSADTTPVTEAAYNELLSVFNARPFAPEGCTYMLRNDDLSWELVELPPEDGGEVTAEDIVTAIEEAMA